MTNAFPLSGIVVLDMGQIYQGPYATFLLAMAGARVIKIEPPTGEYLRARTETGGAAMPFSMLNSNKESIVIDVKTEAGRDLLLQLVEKADILLENFAPTTMERLGLGWDTLRARNPRLIYANGSGYGRDGPYKDYPAMDLTIQAMSGIMSITGFPEREPVKSGPALCDFSGGIHLYAGILTALYEREKTGAGGCVEISLQDVVYPSLASNLSLWYQTDGEGPPRTGNRHGGLSCAPYNVYPCSDGYLAIITVGERQWVWMAEAMGQPDLARDPRFATQKARIDNIDELDALVADWTATMTKEVAFQLLLKHRVPAAPVRDLSEVIADKNMHARGMLNQVDHREHGPMVLPNTPLRFRDRALLALKSSPLLNEHEGSVLRDWYGLTPEEIEALRRAGALAQQA